MSLDNLSDLVKTDGSIEGRACGVEFKLSNTQRDILRRLVGNAGRQVTASVANG